MLFLQLLPVAELGCTLAWLPALLSGCARAWAACPAQACQQRPPELAADVGHQPSAGLHEPAAGLRACPRLCAALLVWLGLAAQVASHQKRLCSYAGLSFSK